MPKTICDFFMDGTCGIDRDRCHLLGVGDCYKPTKDNLCWVDIDSGVMPVIGRYVIGFNSDTEQMEFGFRSEVDEHLSLWVDFAFPITHWAYANTPTGANNPTLQDKVQNG